MASYWVKNPGWLNCFFPREMVWHMPADNTVYLTFDDGPHPSITPFVLQELAKHNAKATFFCVGNNVAKYPDVYQQTIAAGHSVGNHTYNHINGWKHTADHYLKNIGQAAHHINSRLFRPPYGRIKLSQYRKLIKNDVAWKVYMWDVLSGDFDTSISAQQCVHNVVENIRPGSIVVFHDSEKAWERMKEALPAVLAYCQDRGWQMRALPMHGQ